MYSTVEQRLKTGKGDDVVHRFHTLVFSFPVIPFKLFSERKYDRRILLEADKPNNSSLITVL